MMCPACGEQFDQPPEVPDFFRRWARGVAGIHPENDARATQLELALRSTPRRCPRCERRALAAEAADAVVRPANVRDRNNGLDMGRL